MASKPSRCSPKNEQWVVVAEYRWDPDADMAVGMLESNGVPVMRFPVMNAGALSYGAVVMEPIRVLVPPDRAKEARELLEE